MFNRMHNSKTRETKYVTKINDDHVVDGLKVAQQLQDFEYICKQFADWDAKPSETVKKFL